MSVWDVFRACPCIRESTWTASIKPIRWLMQSRGVHQCSKMLQKNKNGFPQEGEIDQINLL